MKYKSIQILITLTVGLLILLSASTVAAQDFYVGASAGSTEFDGSQFGERNTAWGLQLGWNLGRYFGVEFGYTNHQEFDSRVPGQLSPHPKSLSLSGLVRYPILGRIELFGKFGWNKLDTDIDSSNPFYAKSLDESNKSYGVGILAPITDSWQLRIMYDRTELNLGTIPAGSFFARSNGDLDMVSAGIIWNF